MKKLPMLALFGFFAAQAYSAPTFAEKSDSLSASIERIMAKAGISVGGEFRSQYLSSTIGDTGAVTSRRTDESAEFTSVDFDIKARPNTLTQARVIFRMHQDWRNFFSDVSNPIFTRWLSIDGSVKDMVWYNVGNFKQKYTPLTLYSPGIDILYEPTLFAREREVAEQEAFLENNQRVLQGVNINAAAEVAPLFDAVRLGLLGSRLRNVDVGTGNGQKSTEPIATSPVEKFLVAANGDLTFLKGFSLGGTYMRIFDNEGSYMGNDSLFKLVARAQNTSIIDVRGGVDAASLLNTGNFKASLSAELAMSADDTSFVDTAAKKLTTTSIDDNALRACINADYSGGSLFSISLDAAFINNGSKFRNELAQSPQFRGARIMNVENDTPYAAGNKFDAGSVHYSTFDALYRSVFKFCPTQATDKWGMAPFTKLSYTNVVRTQSELAKVVLDPAVQLVMPFGPATPNRTGIDGKLSLSLLDNQIEGTALFASFEEIDADSISATAKLPLTTFSQAGGGAKLRIDKFIGWSYPFYVSGSVVMSGMENAGIANDSLYPKMTITNAFYCGDLYFKFWKRAALLGGLEMIDSELGSGKDYTFSTGQVYYAGGLEYKLADGSYVTGTIGQVKVSYTSSDATDHAELKNFNQTLVNLFLRVRF